MTSATTPSRANIGHSRQTLDTKERHGQKQRARRLRVGPFLTDVLVVVGTIALVEVSVLGGDPGHVDVLENEIPYPLYSAVLAVIWIGALTIGAARSAVTSLDTSAAYRRAVQASAFVFLGVSVFAHFLKSEVSRTYTVLVFVIGLAGLILGKACWNVADTVIRATGRRRVPVVVADCPGRSVDRVLGCLPSEEWDGLEVVDSVTVPDFDHPATSSTDEWVDTIVESIRSTHAGFVVVGARLAGNRHAMQRLAWGMEETGADLMVSPQFGLVGTGRVEMFLLGGQKWVHVRVSARGRLHRLAKRLLDIAVSVVGLAVLGPLMLVIAVLVRRDSDGPALFVQERIGKGGRPFSMLKFRSMWMTPSTTVASAFRNDADGPLFKMHDDPRVTPIGHLLRRFSLDELPQLVNVLRGEMSIVGPRPALPAEVEQYSATERRRLLLTPGLTGPWQIGGRSDLSWEEGIRMDLRYVENWSLTEDFSIIVRTFGAVLRARGAY